MSFVLRPDEARDPERVGGKAAALSRLQAIAPVPPWVVVLPEAFDERGLDSAPAAELEAALPVLGEGPYAVRSSGRQEDGSLNAHAGQFLSRLDVARPDVCAAAVEVWRSGFAENVAAYQAARGVAGANGGAAVIVQHQLRPRVAGVAFSADPVSGRRDRVVISAVAGLGDRLMAGTVDGDTYHVDAATGRVVEAQPAGAVAVLEAEAVADVAALAKSCERLFGAPQDVEWAIADGTLHALQSRPITTLPAAGAVVEDDAVTIWDNSNIVESYPGRCSVLTYSFARHVYAHVYRTLLETMRVPPSVITDYRPVLENMLGRIDGRVYYNLLNWYRVLALFPGFAFNRKAMEQMMGVGEPLPDEIAERLAPPVPKGFAKVAAWLRVARVGASLAWRALRLPSMVRRFERRLVVALAPERAPQERPLSVLAADYRALESALLGRWDAPLVNDLVCMIAFALSRKAMERWAGPEGLALHAEVMIGQGDIVSAEPAQRIRALGRLLAARPDLAARFAAGDATAIGADAQMAAGVREYLARFADRCTEELKLESIPLGDDPAPLLRAIAMSAAAPEPPARSSAAPAQRLATLFAGRPLRRRLAALLLGWAKARVRDRENLRLERTRVFGRVRRIVRAAGAQLAAGGALDHAEDVFFLTIEELLAAIEGGAASFDLRGLVVLRQTEAATVRFAGTAPERIVTRGAVVLSAATAAAAPQPKDASQDGRRRQGVACAPGTVSGPARVIRDPRADTVAPGEILVARHTDPGWIAHFTNAAAIVVERGSLLSHSAIVARELGIPCVVGLKGATEWIASGDRLEVDGRSGWVAKSDG
jgi:rifampicin phosphotransferase